MAATQMNVRMDENLKREGDSVFQSLGYTPSEVVRSVWDFARRNRHDVGKVEATLRELEGAASPGGSGREELGDLVAAGPRIFDAAVVQMGLDSAGVAAQVPYEDLLAAAYAERQAEGGALDHLMQLAEFIGADYSDAWVAAKYRKLHRDYEDNLVVAATLRAKADYLVTSDERLLKHVPVPALSPSDALEVIRLDC